MSRTSASLRAPPFVGALLVGVATACRAPDPDALLRTGDLQGASAAWAATHGAPLDIDHPVADVLAMRARKDPTVTAASLADTMEAVRLLEHAPKVGTHALDLSFDTFAGWFAALDALAEPPALVVVGRSEGLGDADPLLGGPLPWAGGRIVGWARTDLAALGRSIDANPPPKLVVVGLHDATGSVYVNVERRGDAWWTLATDNPEAAARLVVAAGAVSDYGGAALRTREGSGFLRR